MPSRAPGYACITPCSRLLAGGPPRGHTATIEECAEPLGHTVAAAPLDGTLLVLDQHLSPIEWQNYREYVANSSSPVAEVNLLPRSAARQRDSNGRAPTDAPSLPDTYPEDRIDEKLAGGAIASWPTPLA